MAFGDYEEVDYKGYKVKLQPDFDQKITGLRTDNEGNVFATISGNNRQDGWYPETFDQMVYETPEHAQARKDKEERKVRNEKVARLGAAQFYDDFKDDPYMQNYLEVKGHTVFDKSAICEINGKKYPISSYWLDVVFVDHANHEITVDEVYDTCLEYLDAEKKYRANQEAEKERKAANKAKTAAKYGVTVEQYEARQQAISIQSDLESALRDVARLLPSYKEYVAKAGDAWVNFPKLKQFIDVEEYLKLING